MMKRNRHHADRKKRTKIETLKKRRIPIIVKIQSGIFSEEARVAIEQGYKVHKSSVLSRDSTLSDICRGPYRG